MFLANRQQVLILMKLAFPLILTGLVQSSSFYFETLFLAKLGINVLAAGTLVSWLAGTFLVILFGALAAINILVANFYGEKNQQKIAYVLRDGLRLCLILVPLSMLGFWYIADVFYYFGQSQSVIELSRIYLQSLVWGMLPSFIDTALIEFVVGIGEANLILRFSILNAVMVIVLSYLLIFGAWFIKPMGIVGAGLGWSIGSWICFIILVINLWRNKKFNIYFNELFDFSKLRYLTELIKIGMPIGLMYSVEIAFFLVLNICMGAIGGNSMLAANQIVLQYLGIFVSIIFSIAKAITVRMGHLLGERETWKSKLVATQGIIISLMMGLFTSILFLFTPKFLIGLDFDVTNPTNDNIVNLATQFFLIASFFLIFESIRVALFGVLRALQQTHVTLLISIVSFWLIALPLGYYLAVELKFGGLGFWYAMIVGVFISIILLYWRFTTVIRSYT